VKIENHANFQESLIQLAKTKLSKLNNEERIQDLDTTLCTCISEDTDIEKYIEEFHEVLKMACNKTFKTQHASKKSTAHKPVPWWTEGLTIMRKN
jgi:flagellar hook-basal body complex protein FliE